eukprot:s119_g87.t1
MSLGELFQLGSTIGLELAYLVKNSLAPVQSLHARRRRHRIAAFELEGRSRGGYFFVYVLLAVDFLIGASWRFAWGRITVDLLTVRPVCHGNPLDGIRRRRVPTKRGKIERINADGPKQSRSRSQPSTTWWCPLQLPSLVSRPLHPRTHNGIAEACSQGVGATQWLDRSDNVKQMLVTPPQESVRNDQKMINDKRKLLQRLDKLKAAQERKEAQWTAFQEKMRAHIGQEKQRYKDAIAELSQKVGETEEDLAKLMRGESLVRNDAADNVSMEMDDWFATDEAPETRAPG